MPDKQINQTQEAVVNNEALKLQIQDRQEKLAALQDELTETYNKISWEVRDSIASLFNSTVSLSDFLNELQWTDLERLNEIFNEVINDINSAIVSAVTFSEWLNVNWEVEKNNIEALEIAERLNGVLTTIHSKIEKLDIEGITDILKPLQDLPDVSNLETSEIVEKSLDIFKLPMRSPRNILKEEIERNLLEQADQYDWIDKKRIPGLRKDWEKLKIMYDVSLEVSDDKHDNQRFMDRFDQILASNRMEDWSSISPADFVMNSRKIIDGLRRRTDETWDKEKIKNEIQAKKDLLLESIKNIDSKADLSMYDNEDLIEAANDLIERKKIELEGHKEEISDLNTQLKSLSGLQKGSISDPNMVVTLNNQLNILRNDKKIIMTHNPLIERAVKGYKKLIDAWENSDSTTNDDLNKIEETIQNVIDAIKIQTIDGEKSVTEITSNMLTDYNKLEIKQKEFARKMANSDTSKEDIIKYDEEIKILRENLRIWLGNNNLDIDNAVLDSITKQEEHLSYFVTHLDEQFNNAISGKSDDEIATIRNKFRKNPNYQRMQKLHLELWHFRDEEQEVQYLELIAKVQWEDIDSREIGSFYSAIHTRSLETAFGDPTDSDNVSFFGWDKGEWLKNKLRDSVHSLSKLNDKDLEGKLGLTKKILGTIGQTGYDVTKYCTREGANWLSQGAGKTADWIKKSPEGNWFTRPIKSLFKLPLKPLWLIAKPAEKILNLAAKTPDGIDGFIQNASKGKVNDLFGGVATLITFTTGKIFEKASKMNDMEKRAFVRKYFAGMDQKAAINEISKLKWNANTNLLACGKY